MAIDQTNFRIDQETADQFRKFCKDNGMSQAQGFDHLMRILELDRAKTVFPGSEKDLETFEMYVKKITESYLRSVEDYNNAKELAHEQYASLLESKDQTIADLQKKTADLQDAKTAAEQTASSAAKAAAQAVKEAQAAREQAETANKLVSEKDKTISTLADKLSIAESKAAGYDELNQKAMSAFEQIKELNRTITANQEAADRKVAAFSADCDSVIALGKEAAARELADTKKDYESQLHELSAEKDREIASLKKDHETELRELLSKKDREISDAKKDAALELSNALAEKDREAAKQLRDADIEKEKAIREAEVKNARLQAKIELLESQLAELRK